MKNSKQITYIFFVYYCGVLCKGVTTVQNDLIISPKIFEAPDTKKWYVCDLLPLLTFSSYIRACVNYSTHYAMWGVITHSRHTFNVSN